MAIVDAINKVTGGHGATIEEAVKNLSSGGGIMLVHDVDGTLDKTWQEIHDAIASGAVLMPLVDQIMIGEGTKTVSSGIAVYDYGERFADFNEPMRYGVSANETIYYAESANDYPSFKPDVVPVT